MNDVGCPEHDVHAEHGKRPPDKKEWIAPPDVASTLRQRDDWETPRALFEHHHRRMVFNLDPCANAANRVVENYFSREDDGLRCSWSGATVWLHPPHSEANLWSRKAVIESQKKNAEVLALLPARTWEGWWHDIVIAHAAGIQYLRGTPKFRLGGVPVNGKDGRPLPIGGFALVHFAKR